MKKIPLTFILYLNKHKKHCCYFYSSMLWDFLIRHDLSPDFPAFDQHVICHSKYVWMRIDFPIKVCTESVPEIFALLNELNNSIEPGAFVLDADHKEIYYEEKVMLTGSTWELAEYVYKKAVRIIRRYTRRLIAVMKYDSVYQRYLDSYRGLKQ